MPSRAQINKYTGRPFSAKFWQILEKRKNLPVWDYYTTFMEQVKENQCVVLVGETGSGKTTQVRWWRMGLIGKVAVQYCTCLLTRCVQPVPSV